MHFRRAKRENGIWPESGVKRVGNLDKVQPLTTENKH